MNCNYGCDGGKCWAQCNGKLYTCLLFLVGCNVTIGKLYKCLLFLVGCNVTIVKLYKCLLFRVGCNVTIG